MTLENGVSSLSSNFMVDEDRNLVVNLPVTDGNFVSV